MSSKQYTFPLKCDVGGTFCLILSESGRCWTPGSQVSLGPLCLVSPTSPEHVDMSWACPSGPCGARSVTLSPTLLGSVTQPIAGALPLPARLNPAPDQGDRVAAPGQGGRPGHQRPRDPLTPPHPPLTPAGPPSGPTVSASWKSRPCPHWATSPSGTRAGRAAGSTAA